MTGARDREAETYGTRCVRELRRLTNSTWGWTQADLDEIHTLDEAGMLNRLQERAPSLLAEITQGRPHCEPEELARRLVEEGQRRAKQGHGGLNPFDALFDFLT